VLGEVTNSRHKKRPLRLSGLSDNVCKAPVLLDDFDDAAGTGVNQHRSIVNDRVAILAGTVFLRNVVVSHARFGKLSAYPYLASIGVRRAMLFNHITAETRPLIHSQYSGYTADDPSDGAANDSAHRASRAFAFAGASFSASRYTLG
jgi:hypothetical protein